MTNQDRSHESLSNQSITDSTAYVKAWTDLIRNSTEYETPHFNERLCLCDLVSRRPNEKGFSIEHLLSGPLPRLSSLGYSQLVLLNLSNNGITVCADLAGLTSLQTLYLDGNCLSNLDDESLPGISDCLSLSTFSAKRNGICSVSVLNPLKTLLSIKSIFLSNNRLTGADFVTHLPQSTEALDISGNQIDRSETATFESRLVAALPQLKVLESSGLFSAGSKARRSLLLKMQSLTFLDGQWVTEEERAIAHAFAREGPSGAQSERTLFAQRAQEELRQRVEGLRRMQAEYARENSIVLVSSEGVNVDSGSDSESQTSGSDADNSRIQYSIQANSI